MNFHLLDGVNSYVRGLTELFTNCSVHGGRIVAVDQEQEEMTTYTRLLEETPDEIEANQAKSGRSVDISKYSRLIAMGVPQEQIVLKMKMDGFDPNLLQQSAPCKNRNRPQLLKGIQAFNTQSLRKTSCV